MFKVLLIIYVVGGGGSRGIDDTWNTGFEFQEFHSMTDCNLAKAEMENMTMKWHRGDDNNTIKAHYSARCVPMGKGAKLDNLVMDKEPPIDIEQEVVEVEPRKHKRWND